MVRLSQADLEQALAFVNATDRCEDVEAWVETVLPGLRRLVECDSTAFNQVDPVRRRVDWIIHPYEAGVAADHAAFNRNVHQHPLVVHTSRTRDGSAIKLSDFVSLRQLHRLELYDEFFKPVNIEHQMVITVPVPPPRLIGLPLQRSRRDFSERDRRVLNVVRPHLAASYRRVQARTRLAQVLAWPDEGRVKREVVLLSPSGRAQYMTRRAEDWLGSYFGAEELATWLRSQAAPADPEQALLRPGAPLTRQRPGAELTVELVEPARLGETRALLLEERREGPSPAALEALGLTRREAAVLALVAQGETNAQIALALSISARTVQKHIEHINGKLEVGTRTAAAAVAWRAGG